MIQKFAAAALALSMAYTAQAAVDIDAIRYEDTAVVQSANLRLNGAGLRKKARRTHGIFCRPLSQDSLITADL